MLTTAAIGANANDTSADSRTLEIIDAKLYVPVVTLSAEGNAKLSKLLREGFKRSVYRNRYKVIDNKEVKFTDANAEKHIRERLDLSYQGLIQVIRTGCLLDFAYFEKKYRLIAADLSKQRALDADLRAIQPIIFTSKTKSTVANTTVIFYYILEQSKETTLELFKGTTNIL